MLVLPQLLLAEGKVITISHTEQVTRQWEDQ